MQTTKAISSRTSHKHTGDTGVLFCMSMLYSKLALKIAKLNIDIFNNI